MSDFDPLLERNQAFAATGAHSGLTPFPAHQVMVVTCMDARVDPAHTLGLDLGDALVLRNAGGRVTDDVLAEVAFMAELTELMQGDDAPPFEVAVIHHTACGSGFLADDDFRGRLARRTGRDEADLAAAAVTDPEATVRTDVAAVTGSAMLPSRVQASGHVYDLDTGQISTVVPATPVAEADPVPAGG